MQKDFFPAGKEKVIKHLKQEKPFVLILGFEKKICH